MMMVVVVVVVVDNDGESRTSPTMGLMAGSARRAIVSGDGMRIVGGWG
jgi:hypothetical protein